MATRREIKEQVARESERRDRLGVPAFAGGVIYLLSGIIVASTLSGAPTVGLLEGLAPALRGEPNPSVSPRAAEVKFLSHHALALIAGGALEAIAIAALTLVLLLLLDATRFRRPESWPPARPLALIGGFGVALLNLLHYIVLAVGAHSFATGHDFSDHAVDRALLSTGSAGLILGFAGLLVALALAVGMGATMVSSLRAGLLPRWLSVLGVFAGLLFLPFFGESITLELITAFWFSATGILLMGRWPNGDPPAWAAGEARPWPSPADRARGGAGQRPGGQAGRGGPTPATAAPEAAPESVGAPDQAPVSLEPSNGSARRRRRKRKARG
jgi:hypothetical protein